jgi:hypothetical protein
VWVALLNLENVYGQPPEEAAAALLARALQYCDQKKMYLAALAVFERTPGREAQVGRGAGSGMSRAARAPCALRQLQLGGWAACWAQLWL